MRDPGNEVVSAPEKKDRSECRRRNRVCVEVSVNDLE